MARTELNSWTHLNSTTTSVQNEWEMATRKSWVEFNYLVLFVLTDFNWHFSLRTSSACSLSWTWAENWPMPKTGTNTKWRMQALRSYNKKHKKIAKSLVSCYVSTRDFCLEFPRTFGPATTCSSQKPLDPQSSVAPETNTVLSKTMGKPTRNSEVHHFPILKMAEKKDAI